jgi:hypothetical protein
MSGSTPLTVRRNNGYAAQFSHRLSQCTDAGGMNAVIVRYHDIHGVYPFISIKFFRLSQK